MWTKMALALVKLKIKNLSKLTITWPEINYQMFSTTHVVACLLESGGWHGSWVPSFGVAYEEASCVVAS